MGNPLASLSFRVGSVHCLLVELKNLSSVPHLDVICQWKGVTKIQAPPLHYSAGHSRVTCSDVSSSSPQNLQLGSFASPIVCLCFRKVSLTGDNPHHSLCVPSTHCEFLLCSSFHLWILDEFWLFDIPERFSTLQNVSRRPSCQSLRWLQYRIYQLPVLVPLRPPSSPAWPAWPACPLFHFLLFLWGPAARKWLVDDFLPTDSVSDSSRTLTSRWLCTLQGPEWHFDCLCRYVGALLRPPPLPRGRSSAPLPVQLVIPPQWEGASPSPPPPCRGKLRHPYALPLWNHPYTRFQQWLVASPGLLPSRISPPGWSGISYRT